ncbi:MAG: hypothetical protein H5T71_11725, partial [Chloroflexi bacterium]|nr:hypothetical protein [Chloroflexota bacterium]
MLSDEGIRLIAVSADSITLSCTAPSMTLSVTEGATYLWSDWPLWQEPGRPLLPYATTLVALPPEGEISITRGSFSSQEIPLPAPLAIFPEGEEYAGYREISEAPFRLDDVAVMRGVRLGRIVCMPFQVEGNVLRVVSHATLTLRWHTGDS